MKRDIEKILNQWKYESNRLPFSDNPPIISVPFYGIKKVPEMVKHHL